MLDYGLLAEKDGMAPEMLEPSIMTLKPQEYSTSIKWIDPVKGSLSRG